MPTITYASDIDTALIQTQKIAVLGYGSQGHAHALNLFDKGLQVAVGLRPTSKHIAEAARQGLRVLTISQAADWADILMFCTSDVGMDQMYAEEVAPTLRPGQLLLFAHGFNIHYGLINPPADVDVAMVAPSGPGHRLRAEVLAGNGLPALVAVHQDPTGTALQRALGYGWAIGCAAAGLIHTTFKEETETDLFGEQTVLCGGISALIKAGFNTLVEAGYQPEVAYFECLHQVKLIADLLYVGGLSYMRYSISDTAEWGDYVAGPRVINEESRKAMRELLKEVQDGTFAKNWLEENRAGRPNMNARRLEDRDLLIEKVGREIRARIPFIEDKVPPSL